MEWDLSRLLDAMVNKAAEADGLRIDIEKRLAENEAAKEQAASDKKKAMDALNESAYKEASRAEAEADAGIDFCQISLQKLARKPCVSESEHAEIMGALQQEVDAIYKDTILQIEKGLAEVVAAMDMAKRKYDVIDSAATSWNLMVMKDERAASINFCNEKTLMLSPFDGVIRSRLYQLREGKKANPLFRDGEQE